MCETQPNLLDLEKIQAVARALIFAGYQVKEIIPIDEIIPPRYLSSPDPIGKIKLLPIMENLGEINISFSVKEQDIFIVTSTDAGYAFAKNLCDGFNGKNGQTLSSTIVKINLDFSRQT